MTTYRVGNHQPQNLYRNDQYIGVMFTTEDAALAVEALNDAVRLAQGDVVMAHGVDYGQCGNGCTRQTPCRTRRTGAHWWARNELPVAKPYPPHPGESWWWPTECARCGGDIGPWDPKTIGSEMTHIVRGGGADFEANRDHTPVTEGVKW